MNGLNANNTTFGPPTTLDIVIAPAFLIAAMLIGMILQSVITQPRWWSLFIKKLNFNSNRNSRISITPCKDNTKLFIKSNMENKMQPLDNYINNFTRIGRSEEEAELFNQFTAFQNNPIALFKILLPVLLSLAFCPVTIFLYKPMTEFFWPEELTGGMPTINDVVAAFLMPAGLVYAVAFGFAFQDVLSKKEHVKESLQHTITLLRQIWKLINCVNLSDDAKNAIARDLECVVFRCMAEVMGKDDIQIKGTLWDVIDKLRHIEQVHQAKLTNEVIDVQILKKLFKHVLELEESCGNGCQDTRKITVLYWIFLELVGFITFFGIIMLKANSYRLELTLCMLTVFTISAFSYILADFDSSYHGTFKVSLKPFEDFLVQLQHEKCQKHVSAQIVSDKNKKT